MEEECYGEEKKVILAIGATILKMSFAGQGCKSKIIKNYKLHLLYFQAL